MVKSIAASVSAHVTDSFDRLTRERDEAVEALRSCAAEMDRITDDNFHLLNQLNAARAQMQTLVPALYDHDFAEFVKLLAREKETHPFQSIESCAKQLAERLL